MDNADINKFTHNLNIKYKEPNKWLRTTIIYFLNNIKYTMIKDVFNKVTFW